MKPIPPGSVPYKGLKTQSAAEYASMIVVKHCLMEAGREFGLYFDRCGKTKTEDADEVEQAIRRALFRDALVQTMACFTTNEAKRHERLLPQEAFDGIEGWQEFYKQLHALRDSYAAHNFGTMRQAEAMVCVDPDTSDILDIGFYFIGFQGPETDAHESYWIFHNAAFEHVNARIRDLHASLTAEAKALSPDELEALEQAEFVQPDPENLKTGREAYWKKKAAVKQRRVDRTLPKSESQ